MLRAQQERSYDDYERMALDAVWRESAHRSKRIKPDDLFKRPNGEMKTVETVERLKEKTLKTNEWLASLTGVERKE